MFRQANSQTQPRHVLTGEILEVKPNGIYRVRYRGTDWNAESSDSHKFKAGDLFVFMGWKPNSSRLLIGHLQPA